MSMWICPIKMCEYSGKLVFQLALKLIVLVSKFLQQILKKNIFIEKQIVIFWADWLYSFSFPRLNEPTRKVMTRNHSYQNTYLFWPLSRIYYYQSWDLVICWSFKLSLVNFQLRCDAGILPLKVGLSKPIKINHSL